MLLAVAGLMTEPQTGSSYPESQSRRCINVQTSEVLQDLCATYEALMETSEVFLAPGRLRTGCAGEDGSQQVDVETLQEFLRLFDVVAAGVSGADG